MIRINKNYSKLRTSYLFNDIAARVANFEKTHPETAVIKLGIGDVTRPLPQACVAAFRRGVEEMGEEGSFRGYGPEQGYEFLRGAIAKEDFQSRGAPIAADEIFISDGAKCDTGNIQEIFGDDIIVAVPDPVYPVYVDTNVMAGRTGGWGDGRYGGLVYLNSTKENGFVPDPPGRAVDLIYLCFPNNPTGATVTQEQLTRWVAYAKENKALILYDAAYESFIQEPRLPHSIFEIPGAEETAIEFRSFSKTAGFTGTRCAFTVIPKACRAFDEEGRAVKVHPLWNRRHSTKFNGVSYPVQRAAEAVYTEEGKEQVAALIDYYLGNAGIIRKSMESLGFSCTGGDNSPYIWVNGNRDSWGFFDLLLHEAGVVVTPGSGFGTCGAGYIRISAFNSREKVVQAMEGIRGAL